MTRVNVGIRPSELQNKLLGSELHEIIRIPNLVRARLQVSTVMHIKGLVPKTFRLNTGHVTFFYDKLKYIHRRYRALCLSAAQREFDVDQLPDEFFTEDIPNALLGDYRATKRDRAILLARFKARGHSLRGPHNGKGL